ncbi:hypothetical protein Taro_017536 [Colocasia esculenta]|uniref:Peptidase M48 domain-containing protein n=1 Tax=Colocasia esculenta TaxID=4460 RepID=A0A843UTI3_COLES|nr:hypothetical protein [Colocasia esculenta]
MWGSFVFNQQMVEFKGQVLPSDHPQSLRVQYIFRKILETMEKDLGVGGEAATTSRGPRRGATHHLNGLNWEVRVVNGEKKNAYALPGGKIVVFSGIMEVFNSDAEIAIILGHEIAHVVGRHAAESIGRVLLGLICGLVLRKVLRVQQIDLSHDMLNYILQKPFSRGLEKEADRIGLLLSSGAGYDPRIAPDLYRKLGNNTSMLDDYISTHPSGETRAKHLSEDAFMKRAIRRYEESINGEFGFPQ